MKWLEIYGGMEVLSLLFRLPRFYFFDELRAAIGKLGWTIILTPVRQERLGVVDALDIGFEIDADCRRLVRRHWPSVIRFTDVTRSRASSWSNHWARNLAGRARARRRQPLPGAVTRERAPEALRQRAKRGLLHAGEEAKRVRDVGPRQPGACRSRRTA